jgi:hypothetical protein
MVRGQRNLPRKWLELAAFQPITTILTHLAMI